MVSLIAKGLNVEHIRKTPFAPNPGGAGKAAGRKGLTEEQKERIFAEFEFIKNLTQETWSIGSHVINAIKAGIPLPLKLMSMARHVTKATSKFFAENSRLYHGIQSTKYLAAINLPFSIYNLVSEGIAFCKGDSSQKIDSALEVISELGSVGDNVATIAEGFAVTQVVAKEAVAWAGPLAIVSSVLSIAGLIGVGRALYKSHKFYKEFNEQSGLNKPGDYNLADFDKALAFLKAKDDAFLKRHFRLDGGKLKAQIERIGNVAKAKLSSQNPAEAREGAQKLKTTMELLKGRINTKMWSNKLSLLAGTVSLVGLGVLFFTPVAPLAFGLFAAGSAISIGKMIFDKAMEHKFEKALGLKEKKPESKDRDEVAMAPQAGVYQHLLSELKGRQTALARA